MAGEELILVGDPARAALSLSTELARYEAPPVADVNGYYAELGVPTHATRAELFAAYQARGTGSPRLTYIFKQLWNPRTRAAYDATWQGFFPDRWSLEVLLRHAAPIAAQHSAAGNFTTALDMLSSLGISFAANLDSEGDSRLDTAEPQRFDGQGPITTPPWSYSYYLKATTCDDIDRLALWQQDLATALAGCEPIRRLAVGFHRANSDAYQIHQVDGVHIFLLHENLNPSPLLIAAATATAAAL
ncbi:hypothetical protein [Kitasatospora viridis]|uniref:Uncharacterized protein n=1 Tax=Kitasatospora viridis TaxID=281105 RepID=A0A561SA97_9ACTN|nr:hypothetical protein [Kitasatospora viridis]TWF71791.1 hypothetical protein FHX73_18162 [Kitasatospora viridis]